MVTKGYIYVISISAITITGCNDYWYKKDVTPPVYLLNGVEIPLSPVKAIYDLKVKDTVYTLQLGYYDCADCRYHNFGTTIEPVFWK